MRLIWLGVHDRFQRLLGGREHGGDTFGHGPLSASTKGHIKTRYLLLGFSKEGFVLPIYWHALRMTTLIATVLISSVSSPNRAPFVLTATESIDIKNSRVVLARLVSLTT